MELKLYDVQFNENDMEENEGFLVYEETEKIALIRAYNACMLPPDKEEIEKYSSVKLCSYSELFADILKDKTKPFVLNSHNSEIATILRDKGWHMEGEMSCICCGLYPNGLDEYELDEDGYCPDCQEDNND